MFIDDVAMSLKVETHDCYEKKSGTEIDLSFSVDNDKKDDFFAQLTKLVNEYRNHRYD